MLYLRICQVNIINSSMLEDTHLQLSQYFGPIITLGLTTMALLWFKEYIADLVASIRWRMKPGFEPGDDVFLDGEPAKIIKIGITETIFEIDNGRGKVWRYIYNKRIPYHKLEKIVDDSE